ncbi:MAG: hypothetical protein HQM12_11900 [SAR324 cluster bacterium]|nr:hypothetical protein [SAR324 cluster bacterium]
MNEQTLDLSQLPETARLELFDFYEFLTRKYVHSDLKVTSESEKPPFARFLEHPVQLPRLESWTREELHERKGIHFPFYRF